MKVVPAIDLREGHCVQLRGGRYDDELVRLADPVAVARRWLALGLDELHVVDLDAATGSGSNADVVAALCKLQAATVHVGGGLRDDDAVDRVVALGARSAVVGTRAIEDPGWLASVAARHPGRVSLAVDVRGATVTTAGWRVATDRDPVEVLTAASALPLFSVIVTAVDVEGREAGPDLRLVATVRAATAHRLSIAGGVATRDDLHALGDLGVDAVIVGTALYTGVLDPEGLSEELRT